MTDKQFSELSDRIYQIGSHLQNINSTLSQIHLLIMACLVIGYVGSIMFLVAASW